MVVFKVKSFPVPSETFVLNSIVEAIKSGKEVKIITDALKPLSNSTQPELIEKHNLLDKALEFNQPTDKGLRRKKFLALLLKPKRLAYYIKYCLLQKKVSLDYLFYLNFYSSLKQVPTFHVHFLTALKPLLELKQIGFIKSKIIVTIHGYDAHYLPNENDLKKLQSKIRSYVDVITVNSSHLKKKLVDKGFDGSQISVVNIGVDSSFFKRKEAKVFNPETAIKLITIGRLFPLKGQEFGVKAIKELIDEGYKVDYTIVGDGIDKEPLMALVKSYNLEAHIKFTGIQTQNQIKNLLKVHDVFLMTSTIDESGRSEAFGLVSLEAQAIGLPVIGFNAGGFPETIIEKKTGFIVKDKDVAAMTEKIKGYIDNRKLLEEMSQNAIKHVEEKFDISNSNTSYTKFY